MAIKKGLSDDSILQLQLVIDIIKANTDDLGPLRLDFFKKNNLSASWKFAGLDASFENNATSAEPNQIAAHIKLETPRIKKDDSSGDHHYQFVDSTCKTSVKAIERE
ncbi:hypothetical protein F0562_019149 [Nyssa sinensis]|uniref:Uncharacterized protein n=1 Tax=Nyssa sinensis TaxID=561372 RepID=A0A5J4ZC20_9ASTE|nr:hypothetical protein F0562_019149 [Nyssa sinensis]